MGLLLGGIDDGKKHLYVIVEMRKVGVFVFFVIY